MAVALMQPMPWQQVWPSEHLVVCVPQLPSLQTAREHSVVPASGRPPESGITFAAQSLS